MIKNREIGRNLVKFRPDLIKSERAMGYLTGSLGLKFSDRVKFFKLRPFLLPIVLHFKDTEER